MSKSFSYLADHSDKPKRARCEENWAELVVAVVIADPSVNTKDDVLNHEIALEYYAHSADLLKRSVSVVYQYIQNFKKEIATLELKVDRVVILGKNQKKDPEIEQLQQGLDRKEKKSDVMAKRKDGSWVGFSVKSGPSDTLTNYAIEKFLPNSEQLKKCRLSMIERAGLPLTLDKSLRPMYNDLFRGDNDYHTLLIASVVENKERVLNQWLKNLFAETPFDIYSFDGEKLRPSTYNQIKESEFDIRPTSNARGAAKTFFEVSENGVSAYIWDVRWKGSVFVSPQILTHRIH